MFGFNHTQQRRDANEAVPSIMKILKGQWQKWRKHQSMYFEATTHLASSKVEIVSAEIDYNPLEANHRQCNLTHHKES